MTIRKKTDNDNEPKFSTGEGLAVNLAVDYFNRISDLAQVKSRIKQMYGTGIKAASFDDSNDSVETYAKVGFTTQMDAGMLESLNIGFGNKVVNALATLFIEEDQVNVLVNESVKNPARATKLLESQRNIGGYETAIVRADRLSIQVGSAALLLSFADENVTYQHISPGSIRAIYHNTIEGSNGVERPTDQRDIEDATYIIIKLSVTENPTRWNYLAIFGRSEIYPKGRYVNYESGDNLDVPDVGTDGVIDYTIDGEPCNPLSHYAAANPTESFPEYPIAVIYGSLTDSDTALPVTLSLYNSCLEISCAASHTLNMSQEATIKVISRDETAAGKPLPPSLTGAVSLSSGQKIELLTSDSKVGIDSYSVLKKIMTDTAASYNVPDYMMSTEETSLGADSGIALEIKTEPLLRFRKFREKENRASVEKIFDIEKILISLFCNDDSSAIGELMNCTLRWSPGTIKMPENKKESAERVVELIEKGLYDTIAALRDVHSLPSDQAAIEMYDLLKNRGEEYPSLEKEEEPAAPVKGVSLLRKQQ